MTEEKFDFIVVGVGGIGSGTLYWLSRNAPEAKILGLEQFELGHIRGGSQDFSRIIRKVFGYIHEPHYQKLAKGAYPAWEALEEESGLKLLYKCGGLQFLDPACKDSNKDNRTWWKDYNNLNIEGIEKLDASEMKRRWPQFQLHPETRAIYEPEAGFVDAALANSAHQQCALARGVKILDNTKVTAVQKSLDHHYKMQVFTDKGTFLCKKVIITSGAWVNQVLAGIGVSIPVTVTEENVTYFATPHLKQYTKERFPVFSYAGPYCHVYGLPIHGYAAFKIGCDAAGPPTTGDTRTFTPDKKRENYIKNWLSQYLPTALGPIKETKVCLYTMTKDRDFVIDTLATKGQPDIIVCVGAGHAFKFAGVLGKILSEIATTGEPSLDINAFRVTRPAVTDPNFPFWRDPAVISKI